MGVSGKGIRFFYMEKNILRDFVALCVCVPDVHWEETVLQALLKSREAIQRHGYNEDYSVSQTEGKRARCAISEVPVV